jgi:TM2 domain-containing membrane protein YozV
MNRRAIVAMLLALAVPGAGHFYLGRRGRAFAFLAIVAVLFAIGLAVGGDLYTVAESRGALLPLLASYASMGSGVLYFLARETEPHGSMMAATFEYGRTFTLTAGLMNLLLVLDCYDMAMGRKKW